MTHPRLTANDGYVGYPPEFVRRYRDAGVWTGTTHAAFLRELGERFADATAAIDARRSLSYRELAESSLRAASWLAEQGVQRGDHLVLQVPNLVAYLELFFACMALGVRPVLILPTHAADDVLAFAGTAGARWYVAVERFGGTSYTDIAEQARSAGLGAITIDHDAEVPWSRHEPWSEVTDADPQDVALFLLSGGTTGRSKLIPRTHDDYLYSVREGVRVCRLDASTVMLVVLPVSHNFPMSAPGVLGALAAGGTIVFAADTHPVTAFSAIERHGVTNVALVPPLVINWLNALPDAATDVSSLRSVWVGGAKLSESVARRVEPELGCRLQQVFGMAEGLLNFTRLDDDVETIVRMQGRPLSPADEVRVVDGEGQPVPPAATGHLQTRGPYTIRGYYRAPEKNAASFTQDGFYVSGDLVRQDANGNLEVVGRVGDQINRGGEKIAPEAVENALLAHAAIHDVSVVGIPDPELGQRICAWVVLRAETRQQGLSALAVRKFLAGRGVSRMLFPDEVRVVDELPQIGIGKISKREQRHSSAEGASRRESPSRAIGEPWP